VFEGTLEELLALRPPPAAALEALEARGNELDRLAARHADVAAGLEAEAHRIERQLAEASGDFAPPTAADLRAAREARDEVWQRMQNARTTKGDASAQALDSAFDRAVRDADVIADRMIIEADRVTTLARYRAQQTTIVQQRAHAEAERAKAAAQRAALDDEHRRLWGDAGIAAVDGAGKRRDLGLAEMRAWLVRHGQIVDAFAAVREAEGDAEAIAQTIAAARDELATALAGTDEGGGAPHKALAELLDVTSARIERIEGARLRAATAAAAILKLEAEVEERKASALRDEIALGEAKTKLAELLTPLGVPDDADADEVMRALEALRELFSLEDQRADFESRAAVAAVQIASFEEEASLAAATLAADLVDRPAREVVAELAARSRKAHAAEEQLADAELQLADVTGGDAVPEDILALVAEPDTATQALEEVEAQLSELDDELTSETRSIARIEVGLDQMRGDSGAAEASAQAQAALARVRIDLERYVRARAAAVILAREIDRYREENQGPMLTKASQLFARLTLGSFTGVRAGYDDKDRPALRCVREGNVEVDVTGLSEGTRDQLYLSLRLASLMRYADMAEPMPLVLDDVLIQFDDERSRAALSVIAEVATRMQVLFFTHHARMVDLAREAVPGTSLTVHELASPVAASAPALAAP
jgi:plasmid maintenance system antidote protein VapI